MRGIPEDEALMQAPNAGYLFPRGPLLARQ